MAKLGCLCGNTIVDQADNLSYKGYIIPDKKFEHISGICSELIDSLGEANRLDKKKEWINDTFGADYPTGLADSSMASDFLFSKFLDNSQYIYQCENCGRIAIQIGDTRQYQFFLPENAGPRFILDNP